MVDGSRRIAAFLPLVGPDASVRPGCFLLTGIYLAKASLEGPAILGLT
jgi:hypothetical protein